MFIAFPHVGRRVGRVLVELCECLRSCRCHSRSCDGDISQSDQFRSCVFPGVWFDVAFSSMESSTDL